MLESPDERDFVARVQRSLSARRGFFIGGSHPLYGLSDDDAHLARPVPYGP